MYSEKTSFLVKQVWEKLRFLPHRESSAYESIEGSEKSFCKETSLILRQHLPNMIYSRETPPTFQKKFFLEQFQIYEKITHKGESPYISSPSPSCPIINISHYYGTFTTIGETILAHYYSSPQFTLGFTLCVVQFCEL